MVKGRSLRIEARAMICEVAVVALRQLVRVQLRVGPAALRQDPRRSGAESDDVKRSGARFAR